MDLNQNGIQDPGEPGLIQVSQQGSMRTASLTIPCSALSGPAHFDETFPLFNWYVN